LSALAEGLQLVLGSRAVFVMVDYLSESFFDWSRSPGTGGIQLGSNFYQGLPDILGNM